MSITVATTKLVDILSDALQTASNDFGGVHLTTTRAPWRDEPSDVDLLAASSTNRRVLGHTWIPCDGRIDPMVWPCQSVADVLALIKSWAKAKGGDQHTVDISLVLADPPEDAKDDEHPGWTVTLRETPALFDSDNEFQFHAHHESRFPIAIVHRLRTNTFVTREDYEEAPQHADPDVPVAGPVDADRADRRHVDRDRDAEHADAGRYDRRAEHRARSG